MLLSHSPLSPVRHVRQSPRVHMFACYRACLVAEFLPSILAGDVGGFSGQAAGLVTGTGGWVLQFPSVPRLQAVGGLEEVPRVCAGVPDRGWSAATVALASSFLMNLGVLLSKGSCFRWAPESVFTLKCS